MINSTLVTSGIRAHVLQSGPQWTNCGQIEIFFFHAMAMLWERATSTDWELGFSFHKVAAVAKTENTRKRFYLEYSCLEHRLNASSN